VGRAAEKQPSGKVVMGFSFLLFLSVGDCAFAMLAGT
jgi:hypothetical protein